MNKHHLHKLLSRYQNQECTEQEKRLVEQWFSLLDDDQNFPSFSENQHVEERLWKAIQEKQTPVYQYQQTEQPFTFNWRWAAAAVIFLAVIWGGYRYKQNYSKIEVASRIPANFLSKINETDQTITFRLDDGSEISLMPKSSIRFPSGFTGNKREVFLEGKAFFKVAKNPEKPFMIYTGEVVTKVLGTSFWVDQSINAVEVSVVTGKVSVYPQNEKLSQEMESRVVLTPNQKVSYSVSDKTFLSSLVAQPVMPVSFAKTFVFDDTPLPKVIAAFEKAYGIEIILNNAKMNGCLFTADIGKQPMFTKLDLICSSVNAKYEVKGTKIIITGKGCQPN